MTATATTTKPGRTLATLTVDSPLNLRLDGHGTATLTIGGEPHRFRVRADSLLADADMAVRANGYVPVIGWAEGGTNRLAATVEPHPLRCQICVDGCDCTVEDGCGHDGCWGRNSTNDCDGIHAVR